MHCKIYRKPLFLTVFMLAGLLLAAAPAHADCLSPAGSEGELAYKSDDKLLVYCSGAVWRAAHQPGSGTGGCAMPDASTRAEGTITYNEDHRVMQVCAGNVWRPLGAIAGCKDIGDICEGGSFAGMYYLGMDNNRPLLIAPEDEPAPLSWGPDGLNEPAAADDDGLANTTFLTADGHGHLHPAAQACADRGDGYYLPAINELALLNTMINTHSVTADLTPSDYYVSSSEYNMNTYKALRLDNSFEINPSKSTAYSVRCYFRGGCVEPSGNDGDFIYNEANGYYQYCNGLEWVAIGNKGMPAGCPNAGDQCDDNSYYIGRMNGYRLYMADATSDVTRTWNDGSGNYSQLNINDPEDGLANTLALVALDSADDPYEAAEYCYNLVSLGHADWYLPATDEMALVENGGAPLGDIGSPASGYWTSTEDSDELAVRWFMPGGESDNGKYQSRNVRCMRRE